MTEEQKHWVRQLKKGDQSAAFPLYKAYSAAMYTTLLRLVKEEETAKDLLQDGFVKAFKQIKSLNEAAAFGGWLKQIMIREGLNFLRKRKMRFESIDESVYDLGEEVEQNAINPEDIHRAVQNLPDGCRIVLSLHVFESFKHKEIAEKLGITESTSKSQYRYAKSLLKRELETIYEH